MEGGSVSRPLWRKEAKEQSAFLWARAAPELGVLAEAGEGQPWGCPAVSAGRTISDIGTAGTHVMSTKGKAPSNGLP